MMNALRGLARKRMKAMGLQRVRHPSFTDLIAHHGITTVLDVGANDGLFGTELREGGYRGRIISFEPIGSIFAALQKRAAADRHWDVVNLALGEIAGPQTISISKSDVFSSFKAPSDYAAKLWTGIHEARAETVQVARLDAVLDEHPDYARDAYLKIDTQGFEMEVLRGTGSRLRDFKLVHAELALTQLYEGQHGWTEVIGWMAERGFGVVACKENGVDWPAMRLLEMDIVFERL